MLYVFVFVRGSDEWLSALETGRAKRDEGNSGDQRRDLWRCLFNDGRVHISAADHLYWTNIRQFDGSIFGSTKDRIGCVGFLFPQITRVNANRGCFYSRKLVLFAGKSLSKIVRVISRRLIEVSQGSCEFGRWRS